MKRKIAILIPSGEIYDHDRVRSYFWNEPKNIIESDANIGDTFVYEATLRLLDFEKVVTVPLFGNDIEKIVEAVQCCDYAILRGSNYLHPKMCWGQLPEIISRTQIPIIPFGIGVQAPAYQKVMLSSITKSLMKMISERCTSIGVRGVFSAEILNDIGIHNVDVIGCPSLMRNNRPTTHISDIDLRRRRKIGFTITRGLEPMYAESVRRATQVQIDAIRQISKIHDITLISQGEKIEKNFYYKCFETYKDNIKTMINDGWIESERDPMLELYHNRIFFGSSPREYDLLLQNLDMATGFRLHGNIMALSNEMPSLYFVYDTRTRELADHFLIPSYDIMSNSDFSLEMLLQDGCFDRFNSRYPLAYRLICSFLERNKISHKMAPCF